MTKNEQIEEMANIIRCKAEQLPRCPHTTCSVCKATELYTAGYRKIERGEWRFVGNANGGSVGGTLYFKCPFCGYEITQARIGEANFCEWCGADMRGEKG